MSILKGNRELPVLRDYVGVFFVAFATLMYELLLTRLFSVVTWYHFAFVAISVALFGMTFGAIGVYMKREWIREKGERAVLARWSLYFGVSMVFALFVFMSIPMNPGPEFIGFAITPTVTAILLPLVTFIPILVAITIPFIASGVVLALALTHFSRAIERVYAADLLGAALGCFGVIAALQLTDGPTSVLIAALVAILGSLAFGEHDRKRRKAIVAGALGLAIVVAFSLVALSGGTHPFRLIWGKHGIEPKALSEEWNSFSRVSVYPVESQAPFGWGLSDACDVPLNPVNQLFLNIDGDAGTILTGYDGDLSRYQYLGCDVTNIAYHLSSPKKVFIIGAGGGRDVLSSKVFGAQSVTAVELNGEILAAVNGKFSDFTGNLDKLAGITFVNDEARSYLTRHKQERYDLIHVSLIDTWAATAAGAFALSENALYTQEAWELFLNRLTNNGMLSVSRWYKEGFPAETYRTVSLAQAALKNLGVKDPSANIMLALSHPRKSAGQDAAHGVSTLLVSRSPITPEIGTAFRESAQKYGFRVLAAPGSAPEDPVLRALTQGDLSAASRLVPANIEPPTDNRPFFFNFIRLGDLVNPSHWRYHNMGSLGLLASMSLVVIALVAVVFFVPFRFIMRERVTGERMALAAYFLGIGVGFMAIEIGLLQRLAIFFGHPSYALFVVLPVLLVASGLGSMASGLRIFSAVSLQNRILLLIALLAGAVIMLPWFVSVGAAWETPYRVFAAGALLFPLGFLMGMPFAMGMRLVSQGEERLTPWLWGLNGVASVAASVLAVLLSLIGGITFAFLLGIAGYLVSALTAKYATTQALD